MWVSGSRASSILFCYLNTLDSDTEFLIPANVCPVVLAVFAKAGIPYILVDIEDSSLSVSRQSVENYAIEKKGNFGLLYVRTFGAMKCRNEWFNDLKNRYPLIRLIDDRCLCIPKFKENNFSSAADLTLFSTGYGKFVEYGEGGYGWLGPKVCESYRELNLTFSEADHSGLITKFNQVMVSKESFQYVDNDWLICKPYKTDTKQYMLNIKSDIDDVLIHKKTLNGIYKNNIPEKFCIDDSFNYWRYSIMVNNKDEVLQSIFDAGYFASSHYMSLAGIFDNSDAPVARMTHNKIVNLFNDFRISPFMAEEIGKLVKSIAR
jgi:hypothetical protein